eukprot:3672386-Pyramimonas_sp.AAC.1
MGVFLDAPGDRKRLQRNHQSRAHGYVKSLARKKGFDTDEVNRCGRIAHKFALPYFAAASNLKQTP